MRKQRIWKTLSVGGLFLKVMLIIIELKSQQYKQSVTLNFIWSFHLNPQKSKYRLEFIASWTLPLKKIKEPNAQFDYPIVCINGATGLCFCGLYETQRTLGPDTTPMLPKVEHESYTSMCEILHENIRWRTTALPAGDTCPPSHNTDSRKWL